jgi:hypothetical protein
VQLPGTWLFASRMQRLAALAVLGVALAHPVALECGTYAAAPYCRWPFLTNSVASCSDARPSRAAISHLDLQPTGANIMGNQGHLRSKHPAESFAGRSVSLCSHCLRGKSNLHALSVIGENITINAAAVSEGAVLTMAGPPRGAQMQHRASGRCAPS